MKRISLPRRDSIYGPLIVHAVLFLAYLAAALIRGEPLPPLPPIAL